MLYIQVLVNGLVLGGLYSAIAVGFSLVWGVLNIINLLHGSLIILGSYAAFFAHQYLHSIRSCSCPPQRRCCSASATRPNSPSSTA